MCPYSELFWSVFSAFGLNTERYFVSPVFSPNEGKCRRQTCIKYPDFHFMIIMKSIKSTHGGVLHLVKLLRSGHIYFKSVDITNRGRIITSCGDYYISEQLLQTGAQQP